MRNVIKFKQNWNNKLSSLRFTTFRLKDDAKYKIGQTYAIILNSKIMFYAEIMAIEHKHLEQIDDFEAGLDTGYSAVEFKNLLTIIYKGYDIDWTNKMISKILLKKLPNTSKMAIKRKEPIS